MRRTQIAILAATLVVAWAAAAHAQTPRHLFLDPAFLQKADGTALRVNPPVRKELVIQPDKPWEKLMISFFLTVRDEGGKLRMWYICRDADNQPNVAYAESADGVAWAKPNLGIVDYHGSTDNNLVGIPSLEGVVYRDPKAATPAEQYIYVTHVKGKGMVRFTSPDGLRWRADEKPLIPFSCDTQNVTFWDERVGQYVLYLRSWAEDKDWTKRLRRVVRLTADKLTEPLPIRPAGDEPPEAKRRGQPHIFNEVPTVFAADAADPPNVDVYNLSAQPYPLDPQWTVGFPSFFLREKGVSDGRLEVQFTGSRDGIAWQRYDRRPYVTLGPPGSDTANIVFIGTGMAVRGNEIWQYGTGFRSRHGDVGERKRQTDGVIYRYVQRLDGFVSLDFDKTDATCTTAPVKIDGPRLCVNVDTGALGNLRVGLLDEAGRPIPGFGIDDCLPIHCNSVRATVVWKGRPDLAALKDKNVQVTFSGTRARLYSFYFDNPTEAAK